MVYTVSRVEFYSVTKTFDLDITEEVVKQVNQYIEKRTRLTTPEDFMAVDAEEIALTMSDNGLESPYESMPLAVYVPVYGKDMIINSTRGELIYEAMMEIFEPVVKSQKYNTDLTYGDLEEIMYQVTKHEVENKN